MRKAIGLLTAFILGAGVGTAGAAELTKVAVSYSATADFSPAFTAKDTGIFEKHGLDVTLTNLATTSLGPPALMSGSLQIASSSPPLLLLANDGGMDLVAVAGVAAMDEKHPRSSLITRTGFTATKAQDFIGKKIARPGINSAIDLVLKKWLLDHGVALNQVTLVETPFTQMGDLLKAGQIDAAFELEPLRSRIIDSGAAEKSVDIFSATKPNILASMYASSRAWAESHRDALKAFRASLEDAIAFAGDHPDQAKAIQTKYIGAASTPDALQIELHPADFDFWIGALNQLKLLQQQPPPAEKLIIQ
ncbi:MAG TPA: ABC transporter substrate-binding protein [Stellaceae bacterium]|jgi:NitT/TauT family transport system substrate-binding protein|nr:ABC transporter substrate-binding protein [Stellaceae bacterium]